MVKVLLLLFLLCACVCVFFGGGGGICTKTEPYVCHPQFTHVFFHGTVMSVITSFVRNSSIIGKDVQVDRESGAHGKWMVGVAVTVRVTLRDGTYHEDIGFHGRS